MKILALKEKSKKLLNELAESVKSGKVVIFPTDTVYGLLADATNEKAVDRIFKIKKRLKSKPLPIFVKDIEAAKKIAEINKSQEKFLKKYWPGKFTVVLKRKTGVKIYGVDKKTIALRIPNYKFVNYLLSATNLPLTGTSANISGLPASTRIEKITNQFRNQKNKLDLIINVGNLKKSKSSKVVDLTGKRPKILRR